MVAVLDPTALTGFRSGPLSHSAEDDQIYLIATDGAVPIEGVRGLTTLDDAQLTPIGSDWLAYVGSDLTVQYPASPVVVGDSLFEGQLRGIYHGPTGTFQIDAASTGVATDVQPIIASATVSDFAESPVSGFWTPCDAKSLRLWGMDYGLQTTGDGTAALGTSPDTGHARDQVLKCSTPGGQGTGFGTFDLRYMPHDGERTTYTVDNVATMASGHWRGTLAVSGKAGQFLAGFDEATNQTSAEFTVGFTRNGSNFKLTANGAAVGRVLPLSTMVEVHVAWTATTLTVQSRKQGETEWTEEYAGTGLTIAAIRSLRYGLWSPAYAPASVWIADMALGPTLAEIDRDFSIAGSGTRDAVQDEAAVALVVPDGLFTGMTQARLRYATGSDPSAGTVTSWVALAGKSQSVLPLSLTGLTHNTAYSYQFEIGNSAGAVIWTSDAYQFRTLANAGTASAVQMAFASCFTQQPFGHPYTEERYVSDSATSAYRGTLHLGDYIYELGGPSDVKPDYLEDDPPVTADDFERQTRDYFADIAIHELMHLGVYYCTPDDHECINQVDGRMAPGGTLANTLANDWSFRRSDNYGTATLGDIYNGGRAAHEAWFGAHLIDRPSAGVLYNKWTDGKVEIILIDTRYERDEDSGLYVSATQLAWIKDCIDNIAATTELILFVSQTAFADYTSKSTEAWEELANTQWEDFYDYAVANIDPSVRFAFVSGDDHIGFAHHYIVTSTTNTLVPDNFYGEVRASGGSQWLFDGAPLGYSDWYFPATLLMSASAPYIRASSVIVDIGAGGDSLDLACKVDGVEYTATMINDAAFDISTADDILEWWDASDNTTAFSDFAATTAAVAGSTDCKALLGKVNSYKIGANSNPFAYVTEGVSGEKAIYSDGTGSKKMNSSDSFVADNFQGDDKPFVLVAAAKRAATGASHTIFALTSTTGSTDRRHVITFSSGDEIAATRSDGTTSPNVASSGTSIGTDWEVITIVFTGYRTLIRRNGVQVADDAQNVGTMSPLNYLNVGARYQQSTGTWVNLFNGYIGEIALFTASGLTKDVLRTENALLAKWSA